MASGIVIWLVDQIAGKAIGSGAKRVRDEIAGDELHRAVRAAVDIACVRAARTTKTVEDVDRDILAASLVEAVHQHAWEGPDVSNATVSEALRLAFEDLLRPWATEPVQDARTTAEVWGLDIPALASTLADETAHALRSKDAATVPGVAAELRHETVLARLDALGEELGAPPSEAAIEVELRVVAAPGSAAVLADPPGYEEQLVPHLVCANWEPLWDVLIVSGRDAPIDLTLRIEEIEEVLAEAQEKAETRTDGAERRSALRRLQQPRDFLKKLPDDLVWLVRGMMAQGYGEEEIRLSGDTFLSLVVHQTLMVLWRRQHRAAYDQLGYVLGHSGDEAIAVGLFSYSSDERLIIDLPMSWLGECKGLLAFGDALSKREAPELRAGVAAGELRARLTVGIKFAPGSDVLNAEQRRDLMVRFAIPYSLFVGGRPNTPLDPSTYQEIGLG